MISTPRKLVKQGAGWLLAHSSRKFHFRNGIFILAHMRCGSTALSNILCSRDDVSGYGEAHIRYDGRAALGQLALNQRRRGGWSGSAAYLFDKILHNRHDSDVPPEFFDARAIFVIREPEPAIRSICKLFADLGRAEYQTHQLAAQYYAERLHMLAALWDRFAPEHRCGITHAALLGQPDAALAHISAQLNFYPPLENRYVSNAASRKGGGGDPMISGKHSKIEPALLKPAQPFAALELEEPLIIAVRAAYRDMERRFATQLPDSLVRRADLS